MKKPNAMGRQWASSILALAALSLPVPASAQTATASAAIIDGVAYLAPAGFQHLKISHDLSPERLAQIIPLDEGRFEVGMVRCAGVSPTGRLEGCTSAGRYITGGGYAPAAAIADHLSVAPGTAAALKGPVRNILVAIRFEHSVAPATSGPCYFTVCTAVLPPPPPPPPPPVPLAK